MVQSKKDLLIVASLLLFTAFIYNNSLRNPFTADDYHIIVENFLPRPAWTLGDMFRLSLFPSYGRDIAYYRPLTLLTFATNYDLFFDQPWGYRAVNLMIHLIAVSLVYFLLSRLTLRWIAAFAALLFAVHPANVMAITYISSRSDPLYTGLVLACLFLWHCGSRTERGKGAIFFSAAIGTFFLGLLSKETAIVAPILALGMDALCPNQRTSGEKVKEHAFWYLGFVVALVIYLYIRLDAGYPLLMERGGGPDMSSRILLAFKLLSLYLGLAFYPLHLSAFRMVSIPKSPFAAEVVVGAVLLAALILLAYLYHSKRREVTYGIFWFLVSLFPVLNLTRLNAPMMEHWLYLPLIGLTLAFVGVAYDLACRIGEIRGAALGLSLLALLLSVRTIYRNAEWGDLVKLFSQDVAHYPRHERAWAWLGDAYKAKGEWQSAIEAYRTSLQINPRRTQNWLALASALSLAEQNEEAEEILSWAVGQEPLNPLYRYHLGLHLLKLGKNEEAINTLKENSKLDPPLPLSYHALGSAYLRVKNLPAAEAEFQRALKSYHGDRRFHAGFHVNLGRLYSKQDRINEASEEWQLALRFDPNHAEARSLLKSIQDRQ